MTDSVPRTFGVSADQVLVLTREADGPTGVAALQAAVAQSGATVVELVGAQHRGRSRRRPRTGCRRRPRRGPGTDPARAVRRPPGRHPARVAGLPDRPLLAEAAGRPAAPRRTRLAELLAQLG